MRAHDAHAVAVHVDLLGDINDALGREGVFAPGVGDLSIDDLRVGIDAGPGSG